MALMTYPPGRRMAAVAPLTARLLDLMREEHLALEHNDINATSGLFRAKERAIVELRAALAGTRLGAADAERLREVARANLALGIHVDTRLAYARARLAGLEAAVAAAGARPAAQTYDRLGRQGSRAGRLGATQRA